MNEKIKNIEFLRIIGCFAIILFHFFEIVRYKFPVYMNMDYSTLDAGKAVDLFFIISGVFFALTLDTTKTLWQFLKKKLIRLFPVIIVTLAVSFCVGSLFKLYDVDIFETILILLGFNGTALVNNLGSFETGGRSFWYVSAMLWTFLLYFYLLKNYERKNVNLIIGVMVYCAFAILVSANWTFIESRVFVFNMGMCRAIGGIGLGYFIGQWYNSFKDKTEKGVLPLYVRTFLTILEFLCVYFIIYYLFFKKINFENPFIFVVIFALTVVLFLYNQGYVSKLLNQNIFAYLSKYTYSIYIVHCYIIYVLQKFFFATHKNFVEIHPFVNLAIALYLVIFFGVLMYHLVEKPASKYLKKFVD